MSKFTLCFLACFLAVGASFAGDVTRGFSRDDDKNAVVDNVYRLMWQDDESFYEGKYDEAVRYCENLNFAGYDDWRLPEVDELISITDKSGFNPAINKAFKYVAYEEDGKGGVTYGWYWSATRNADGSSRAWHVNFKSGGNDDWNEFSDHNFVRCVREF